MWIRAFLNLQSIFGIAGLALLSIPGLLCLFKGPVPDADLASDERPSASPPLFPLQGGSGGLSLPRMNTPLAFIGGLGGQEMIVIFLIVLLLFGAKKLPELARGVGKSMGEFKKAREDFEKEITRSEDDVRIKEAAGKEAHDKA